jgi:hypothetical protein
VISQTLKDDSEVVGVLCLALGIYENIIDKDHDNLSSSVMNTEFMRYMK